MLKKKFLMALSIAMLICSFAVALVACAPKKELYIDTSDLKVEMFDDYYIGLSEFTGGNTFDLSTVFKDSAFELPETTNSASLTGNKLKMYKTGTFKLNVNSSDKTVTKNIFLVDGVNVADFNQFENVLEVKQKNAIIHNEIVFIASGNGASHNVHITKNLNIYGNGNVINAEAIVKSAPKEWGGDAIIADSESVNLQDFHIVGVDMRGWSVEQKKTYDIGNLERFGSLISYRSNNFTDHKVGGTIKNVVAENGHALVSLTGCTVNIEGSIFKNAADSLISVQTQSNGGTKLNLKNNVFINAVVAAVTCWGYTKAGDNDYLDLTVEGFMDVYNWKDSASAKLMPNSEAMASMVNGVVSQQLNSKKNSVYMYKLGDKKYIHVAIIILATGSLKNNGAKLNGIVLKDNASTTSYVIPSTDNFVLKELPGASLANTALVVGYGNNDECKGVRISPSTKLDLNTIYSELRNGRK